MTTLYDLASRLCGMAAVVCLALAFLASPAVSRADDDSGGGPCASDCEKDNTPGTPEYAACMQQCQTSGNCASKVDSQGKYLGCVSPGKSCPFGMETGLCGDSPNKGSCTCVP